MSSQAHSKNEMLKIIDEIGEYFGDRLQGKININDINKDWEEAPDNLLFLRFYVKPDNKATAVKVELLQNIYCMELEPIEYDGLRILPIRLIAILKLAAANDRAANKDIYDMYFLTTGDRNSLFNICQDYDNYKNTFLPILKTHQFLIKKSTQYHYWKIHLLY